MAEVVVSQFRLRKLLSDMFEDLAGKVINSGEGRIVIWQRACRINHLVDDVDEVQLASIPVRNLLDIIEAEFFKLYRSQVFDPLGPALVWLNGSRPENVVELELHIICMSEINSRITVRPVIVVGVRTFFCDDLHFARILR